MSTYPKFLPPDDLPEFHRPFWDSVKAHAVALQKCDACGAMRYIPAEICPRCGADKCIWTPIKGRGRVYTYTVIHRAPTPAYQADAPYAIVHVELDEGPRMISNMTGCKPEDVRIGMSVEIVYEDVSEKWTLFKFAPSRAS